MTAVRPTSDQIAAEIEALETMKPFVRRWTAFQDDNHAAIEAQIRVLRERLGYAAVHDVFGEAAFDDGDEDDFYGNPFDDDPGSFSDHVFTNALDASNWMNAASADPAPSVAWADLVPEGAVPLTKPRRLISSDEAVEAKCQHTTPCSDCPWARTALNGWLGGTSVDEWLRRAHSDTHVPCHTIKEAQCAGLAVYRKNVIKRVEAPLLVLPADKAKVFATPMEFKVHHEARPGAGTAS